MASRQRKSLPYQSFENGGEASGSRNNVAPPLFLDTGAVSIKNEEEDELFGGSELSEEDQQQVDAEEQDESLQDEQIVAAGLNGFADGHTINNSDATASTSARKTAPRPRKSAPSSRARYELREHLDAPRSLTLSCEILMKRVTSGTVDVNPEYQRETVWTPEKQSALIDSIFRRYYVPPILFSKVQKPAPGDESKTADSNRRSFKPTFQPPPKKSKSSEASGNKRKRKANDDDDDDFEDEEEEEDDDEPTSGVDHYVCIDGKQRLSSIINFMNNHIPVIDPKTKRKYYFRDEPVVKKQGIPLKYRKVFEDSQITVVEYSNLNPGHEREMFARVQMGMTLSPAEKLKAQPGEWASFFREMSLKYMKETDAEGNPMLGSIVDIKRGNDYKCILQFGLIVIKSKTPNFAPMTNELSKWGKTEEALEPLDKKLAKGIEDALSLFTDLLQKGDEGVLPEARWDPTKPNRRNLAPIEWVYVAVFIWTVGSKLTKRNPKQLETSLKKIRHDIRAKYSDVMWKTGIAKDYRESIKHERSRLTEAGILGSSDKKKQKS